MPLQKRVCKECKYEEDDILENIKESEIKECPKCKSLSFSKVFSVSNFPETSST